MFFSVETNGGGYDFDCSGGPQKDPALDVAATCGALCPNDPDERYLSTVSPPCGMPGEWGNCQMAAVCVKNVIDAARKMKCH